MASHQFRINQAGYSPVKNTGAAETHAQDCTLRTFDAIPSLDKGQRGWWRLDASVLETVLHGYPLTAYTVS